MARLIFLSERALDHPLPQIFSNAQDRCVEGRLDRRSGVVERPDQHEIVSHGEVLDGLAINVHLWVLWIAVVVCRDFIGIKPWRFALAVERLGADLLAAMIPYFRNSFANPHSSDHSLRWESSHAVEDAAARVARLIGAGAEEITFTSGATESNNLALLGSAAALLAASAGAY